MRRQRGQTLVEFALMAPMIFLLIFGMIYGGVMFVDYMNLNNDARALARRIAVADTSTRAELLELYSEDAINAHKESENKDDPIPASFKRFYDIKMIASYGYKEEDTEKTNPIDAVVTVTFSRDNKDLPWIVYKVGFPPEHFAITYKMKLEDRG